MKINNLSIKAFGSCKSTLINELIQTQIQHLSNCTRMKKYKVGKSTSAKEIGLFHASISMQPFYAVLLDAYCTYTLLNAVSF